MSDSNQVERFLNQSKTFAVLGASKDRSKYGNKVLRCYQQNQRRAIPIHPSESEIEGEKAYPSVSAFPDAIDAASIITPPPVTERLIPELAAKGVKRVWMQPGAESARAIDLAKRAGMEVIAGGPCLLVALGYFED